ncbi:hypothetical protein CERSUDRAFT_92497 [Gelatoporia subvermispora B]|uniref:Uncharacterized protein n=1 Tax=Ceriporiopsis subvermispora (strain B) TaxID=914234 RepID=M2RME2_CERS8|nr:hypothetical protein CERSUDRAFT_92497 [Gelatoporia subvermispora B]
MTTSHVTDSWQRSLVQEALQKHLGSLESKGSTDAFIKECLSIGGKPGLNLNANEIHETFKESMKHITQPGNSVQKWTQNICAEFQGYGDIINNIVSADPMPTALVWGGLKIVIDCFSRYTGYNDIVKEQMDSLVVILRRINQYGDLYGKSDEMQKCLCDSYVHIFRFWYRVYKDCKRSKLGAVFKSLSTKRLRKLSAIVKDLDRNSLCIAELASLLESGKAKEDREAAQKEYDARKRDRLANERDRAASSYGALVRWIWQGTENIITNVMNFHDNNIHEQCAEGTGQWLKDHESFSVWRGASPQAPVLWLHAPPGSGKTMICSQAINIVREEEEEDAVAYHFYHFDSERAESTATQALAVLAQQLLMHYQKDERTSGEIHEMIAPPTTRALQKVIESLVEKFETTYFFLDGLDEEEADPKRWEQCTIVIRFLLRLVRSNPGKIRIFFSSQFKEQIEKELSTEDCVTVNFDEFIKSDVNYYLAREIPRLTTLGDKKDEILEQLQARAHGNFLWACLVVKALPKAANANEIRDLIHGGLPGEYNKYYKVIFRRIPDYDRARACKCFSLITYARRPLRLKELREAIGVIESNKGRGKRRKAIDHDQIPSPHALRQLLYPLVKFESVGQDAEIESTDRGVEDDNCICHLFHSTMREFILRNSAVLSSDDGKEARSGSIMSQSFIANACLSYLSLPQYTELLTRSSKDSVWVTSDGDSVEDHTFLLYAARYWDKHLDDSADIDRDCKRVIAFLRSPNFVTCLQVQSIWMDYKFKLFSQGNSLTPRLQRVFPRWLKSHKDTRSIWQDYRHFMHEWMHFLGCMGCGNLECTSFTHRGQIDRCWWGSLNPGNFLSSSAPSRFVTFRLQAPDPDFRREEQYFEAVDAETGNMKILWLNSFGACVLAAEHFVGMEDGADNEGEDSERWESDDISDSSMDEHSDQGDESWSEGSSEHSGDDLQYEDDITPWNGLPHDPISDNDSDSTSATSSSSADSSESVGPQSVEDDDLATDDGSEASDVSSTLFRYINADSDEEEGDIYPLIGSSSVRQANQHRVQTLTVYSIDEKIARKMFTFRRPASIMIYASPPVIHPSKPLVAWPLGGGDVLFADFLEKTYFTRKLRPSTPHTRHIFMQCQFSPCGKYLHIASLEGRRRPMSAAMRSTVQRVVKLLKDMTFATEQRDSRFNIPKQGTGFSLGLAVLLSTYRLSAQKTTRCLPTLIHRVRIPLGSEHSLDVSKLPMTLTWTPNKLYLSRSSSTLSVYRIQLFGLNAEEGESSEYPGGNDILVPCNPIILPGTARQRKVYYLPPAGTKMLAYAIIGSEPGGRMSFGDDNFLDGPFHIQSAHPSVWGLDGGLCPPVGCQIQEQADLGGWRKFLDHPSTVPDQGIGKLERKREKFNPEEDCECSGSNISGADLDADSAGNISGDNNSAEPSTTSNGPQRAQTTAMNLTSARSRAAIVTSPLAGLRLRVWATVAKEKKSKEQSTEADK